MSRSKLRWVLLGLFAAQFVVAAVLNFAHGHPGKAAGSAVFALLALSAMGVKYRHSRPDRPFNMRRYMLGFAIGWFAIGIAIAVAGVQELTTETVDGPFYGVLGVVGSAMALALGVMVLYGRRRAPRV